MKSKLPYGLLISLFQKTYDCEYDHAAVIVLDEKGIPFVLESSYNDGYTLTPYSKRILESYASQIVLLPLSKVGKKCDVAFRSRLWNFAQEKVSNSEYFRDNESLGILKGLVLPEFIRKELLFNTSPSCKVVSNFLQELGYNTEIIIGKHSSSINPDDFLNHTSVDNITTRKKVPKKVLVNKSSIFGPIIVVRNI
jgi:hypothetical protein